MPRTRRADLSSPGITRLRRGRGFSYADAGGRRLEDEAAIDRIRALAIPPAWTGVWISTDPRGHIQATGIDARGRKQYRYHPRWRESGSAPASAKVPTQVAWPEKSAVQTLVSVRPIDLPVWEHVDTQEPGGEVMRGFLKKARPLHEPLDLDE